MKGYNDEYIYICIYVYMYMYIYRDQRLRSECWRTASRSICTGQFAPAFQKHNNKCSPRKNTIRFERSSKVNIGGGGISSNPALKRRKNSVQQLGHGDARCIPKQCVHDLSVNADIK